MRFAAFLADKYTLLITVRLLFICASNFLSSRFLFRNDEAGLLVRSSDALRVYEVLIMEM